eukprot:TRINITY_DN9511_c0_g1_i9.p1 TRINITY_DN9511_c0_g1~~TRINITY_DN9511_c0_g1_i9.p1  ORF type:complete len:275 (+),score=41.63 TRINITY_DN9511_c0_g1_i9:98-922(+)
MSVRNSASNEEWDLYDWYFQKFLHCVSRAELSICSHINGSKMVLTMAYMLLFATYASKIALHSYILTTHFSEMTIEEIVFIAGETCLSFLCLFYLLIKYINKIKGIRIESINEIDVWSFFNILFFVKYFTWSVWSLKFSLKYCSFSLAFLCVTLYILYGLFSEKPPNAQCLVISLCLLIFVLELFVRLLLYTCNKPSETTKRTFLRRDLPVKNYAEDKHRQSTCAICLKRFRQSEGVVQLPCHAMHVFHSKCISGWLERSCRCPCCRKLVAHLL